MGADASFVAVHSLLITKCCTLAH